jgi:hypothetical protein
VVSVVMPAMMGDGDDGYRAEEAAVPRRRI